MKVEKENKNIVTSYRLNQDTKEKIQKQLKDMGMTQEQYFNKVVSFMEIENVKQNSFLSKDTTTIQSNLEAILNTFVNVAESSNNLISNKDIELKELKTRYKNMLIDKDSCLLKQKQELQESYTSLLLVQDDNKEHESELSSIRTEHSKQFEQLVNSLKDKDLIVEEYKNKNDILISDLKEYKQYKIELINYKKLLEDAKARNIDLGNSIKDRDYNIAQLNKSVEKLPRNIIKSLNH